jgi:hypothetical protein
MFTLFHKLGFATRLTLLLAVVLATFAASATPAAAANRTLPPTDLGGKLGVYVFDNDTLGKGPIYAAGVTVYNMAGQVVLKGDTNKGGWFNGELEHGKYVVSAIAATYTGNKTVVSVVGGSDTVTKLGLNKEAVAAPGILKVRIWDLSGPAPKPVAGVYIKVMNTDGTVVAKGFTTNEGLFTVSLDAGSYSISATRTGYKPITEAAVVVSNQETPANITLEKEAVSVGQVSLQVFQGGTSHIVPIEGATIKVYLMTSGQLVATGTTDSLGKYGTLLNAGAYNIEIGASGYQTTKIPVKIDPSQDYSARVLLYWSPIDQ